MSALRGKFHGVVDQIGDRLEQKIAVAVNRRLICRVDRRATPLSSALARRIADLAYQRAERHLAKLLAAGYARFQQCVTRR